VVTVVLVVPPAVAHPEQQVAVQHADPVVQLAGAGDLLVAGVVPEERGPGGEDPQWDREQQRPPGGAEYGDRRPGQAHQHHIDADRHRVGRRTAFQQAGGLDFAQQWREVATARGNRGRSKGLSHQVLVSRSVEAWAYSHGQRTASTLVGLTAENMSATTRIDGVPVPAREWS
jgi:hypothetical protein